MQCTIRMNHWVWLLDQCALMVSRLGRDSHSVAGQTLTMPYAGQINMPTVSYMSMAPATAANRTTLYRTLSRVDIANTDRGFCFSEVNLVLNAANALGQLIQTYGWKQFSTISCTIFSANVLLMHEIITNNLTNRLIYFFKFISYDDFLANFTINDNFEIPITNLLDNNYDMYTRVSDYAKLDATTLSMKASARGSSAFSGVPDFVQCLPSWSARICATSER